MATMMLNGKNCFYEDVGEGYPILFGHSYLWTSEMWRPQIEELSKNYRCIVVDLWNHGKSDTIEIDQCNLEQIADDYYQLMQSLGFKDFALIGLSVGGMWGAQLALKYPNAVSALVLMDTFVGAEPDDKQKLYFSIIEQFESDKKFTPEFADEISKFFFSPVTFATQQHLVTNFKNNLMQIETNKIPGIASLGRAIFSRENLLPRLKELKQATAVIVGEDDIARPPQESKQMVEQLPNGELYLIEKAGHICNIEQPKLVTQILQDFLNNSLKNS